MQPAIDSQAQAPAPVSLVALAFSPWLGVQARSAQRVVLGTPAARLLLAARRALLGGTPRLRLAHSAHSVREAGTSLAAQLQLVLPAEAGTTWLTQGKLHVPGVGLGSTSQPPQRVPVLTAWQANTLAQWLLRYARTVR